MYIPENKRHEYWNHFMSVAFVDDARGFPTGITGARLRIIKQKLWNDAEFWQDIVFRHDGLDLTPEEMMDDDIVCYQHCRGNFWGMVMQTAVESGLIKA